jgi:hypothetical protein
MTKQDLIDELYLQRDCSVSIEEWQDITLQIMRLEQEVELENSFTS